MAEPLSAAARRELASRAMDEARARSARGIGLVETGLFELDERIDGILGLKVGEATDALKRLTDGELKALYGEESTFPRHRPRRIQTLYADFFHILDAMAPREGQLIADLGAAFGRLGFFVGIKRPELSFIGYELVKERVTEARRVAEALGLSPRVQFVEQDLSRRGFHPAAADFFYLCDPVTGATWLKLMEDLKAISTAKPITLIHLGSRGDEYRALPWLREVPVTRHATPFYKFLSR